jgi:acetate CoA/acetoacetate CoA-transferase beta subunit
VTVKIDIAKSIIGKRVTREFGNGKLIYIGNGLPLYSLNFIDRSMELSIISESGIIGSVNENSGKLSANGGCYMDMSSAYGFIRGGHVDVAVLGAIQVDAEGSFASWIIPGKTIHGMAGDMEVAVGAKKVIVTLLQTEDESSNIKKICAFPITARKEVDIIITQMGVFNMNKGQLTLIEINPEYTIEHIKRCTEADFIVSEKLNSMDI